jgi:hypothetical protein
MKTKMPLFPGFYESFLGDMASEMIEDGCLDVLNSLSVRWLSAFERITGIELEFFELKQPKEYNFNGDDLIAEIKTKDLQRIVDEVEQYSLSDTIKEYFTPYDGFCPFYSCDIEDWMFTEAEDLDKNEAMVFIHAYLKQEGFDEEIENINL